MPGLFFCIGETAIDFFKTCQVFRFGFVLHSGTGKEGAWVDITEQNVVQQIKKRNETAISFIIRTYGGLLAAIIRRHVQDDRQEYEECLDDVLLAVWNHIDSFDERKNTFKQWIAAIAKYRAIDYQRKMWRNMQHRVHEEIADHMFRSEPATSQPDVEELFAHLTTEERAVFGTKKIRRKESSVCQYVA